MSISYGFFDSKNLDRVYTAEDFNKYLSGLICSGIFDTYGECFKVTANGDLTVTVGAGKAWIDGHYFMSDTPLVFDLSDRVRESISVKVVIGISCDTAENARECKFEISSAGGLGSSDRINFIDTETKKHLKLAEILIPAGAESISQSNITDFRDDVGVCGYVKCILGKCGKFSQLEDDITLLQQKITDIEDALQNGNTNNEDTSSKIRIKELEGRLDCMESILDDIGKPLFALTSAAGAPGSVVEVYLRIYSKNTVVNYTTTVTYDGRLTYITFEGDVLMSTNNGNTVRIIDANETAIRDNIGGKTLKMTFKIPENAAVGTRYILNQSLSGASGADDAQLDCMAMPGVITVV